MQVLEESKNLQQKMLLEKAKNGSEKKRSKKIQVTQIFNILMDRRREENTDFLTISPTIPRSIKCNLSVLSSSYEIVDLLKKYESTRMFFEYYPHPYKNIQSLRFKIGKMKETDIFFSPKGKKEIFPQFCLQKINEYDD